MLQRFGMEEWECGVFWAVISFVFTKKNKYILFLKVVNGHVCILWFSLPEVYVLKAPFYQ